MAVKRLAGRAAAHRAPRRPRTLGVTGWTEDGRVIAALTTNSPCHLSIRVVGGKRHWTVGRSCSREYATWGSDDKGAATWNAQKPGLWAPYSSLIWGIDGVDSVASPSDDRGYVLMFANACALSESPPDPQSKKGDLLPDTDLGFHLIVATPGWMGDQYPRDGWPHASPGRACELIIED